MEVGAKTAGTGLGLAGAVEYAPDLTIVSKYALGLPVDPAQFQQACDSLLLGLWGAVLIVAGLYVGHLYKRAVDAWGNGAPPSEPEPAPTPAAPAA